MQMMANRYRFKLSRMRERWGYYWRLPSILVTALHPPYTQNLCDLLKFILTINVFFYLSYLNTLHPTSKFIIYQTILSLIFLFSLSQGVPQWWHRSLNLSFIINLQPNISTFYAHHVTPSALKEFFLSALPWEYDVYVPPARRTISVSSTRRYSVFILHPHSHKRLTHTYLSSCRIPPGHSLNIRVYFSQAHLHSLILPAFCQFV